MANALRELLIEVDEIKKDRVLSMQEVRWAYEDYRAKLEKMRFKDKGADGKPLLSGEDMLLLLEVAYTYQRESERERRLTGLG